MRPLGLYLAASWRYVGSSCAFLEHVGSKLANEMCKMATKSAKMNQDGPIWVAKANEGWKRRRLTGLTPPGDARTRTPLEP